MTRRSDFIFAIAILSLIGRSNGAEPLLPPGDDSPILRLDAGGPLGYVKTMAFGRDPINGDVRLYAAGRDKVVHVWRVQDNKFLIDRKATIRIPVGPGLEGGINSIALSDDGQWLAVAGRGMVRNSAGLRDPGLIWPAAGFTDEMRLDWGLIYVFSLRDNSVRLLRGHVGPVLALSFAPGGKPYLVSAAREHQAGNDAGRLRIWDVANAKELALPSQLALPPVLPPPALAVARVGNDPLAVRVGLAWGDRKFRVWDVTNNQVTAPELDPFPITSAVLSGVAGAESRFVAGTTGEFGVWNIPALPGGKLPDISRARHFERIVSLVSGPSLVRGEPLNTALRPLAVAVLPSTQRGGPQRAACIVSGRANADRSVNFYVLLIDITRKQVVNEVFLWKGSQSFPSLAVDPTGRHLAVAGNDDDEVFVFDVSNGLVRVPLKTPLRGTATLVAGASFVRNRDSLGLVLNRSVSNSSDTTATTKQIFDLAKGAFVDEPAGWSLAVPELGSWKVAHSSQDGSGPLVSVTQDNQLVSRIQLEADDQLSAYAICPPLKGCPLPLVALGVQRRGEPLLLLFDATTGKQIRQLTGHTEQISQVSFSDDGRLLVSAARDRTVCVWWLADITEESLNKYGLLPGFVVEGKQKQLLVTKNPAGNPKPGEIIEKLVEQTETGEKLISFDSVFDFYANIASLKPGQTVGLTVRSGDEPNARQVAMTVGRAIDERKPLFTLFFAPALAGDPKLGNWVGWDPLGNYDVGGEIAEGYIGWHFNTGKLDAPTRFAGADQYREQNHVEGLLRKHVEEGPQIKPAPPPAPAMSLHLHRPGVPPWEARGENSPEFVTQTKELDAVVEIQFPRSRIKSLTWQIGTAAAVEFRRPAGEVWDADLSGFNWTRGIHPLRVCLTTNESSPRIFEKAAAIRFQPSGPRIELAPEPSPQVYDPALKVNAKLSADAFGGGETVDVTLIHRNTGKVVSERAFPFAAAGLIEETLNLQPGENQIEIVAQNTNALPDFKDSERVSVVRVVSLLKPQDPLIQLTAVKPVGVDTKLPIRDGKVAVESSRIRVQGRIRVADLPRRQLNKDSLKNAEILIANKPNQVAGFKAGGQIFDIDQEIQLEQPGQQTLRFQAQTAFGGTAEATLDVNFRPRLPELKDLQLRFSGNKNLHLRAGQVHDLIAGRDPLQVEFKAELTPPPNSFAPPANADLFVEVLVEGKAKEPPIVIKGITKRQILRGKIDLLDGKNRVELRVVSAWKADAPPTEAVLVRYLHPPRIVAWNVVPPTRQPTVNLTATIETRANLPLKRVAVYVNDRLSDAEAKFELSNQNDKAENWNVEVQNIPLEAGRNELRLAAWNEEGGVLRDFQDGRTLPRDSQEVVYEPPVLPPEIEIQSPTHDDKIQTPQLDIEFSVRSRELQEVVLAVKGASDLEERRTAVARETKLPAQNARGEFVFKHRVKLEVGHTELRLEAKNAGGWGRSKTVTINRIPQPPSVQITQVLTNDGEDPIEREPRGASRPEVPGDDSVHFAKSSHSSIRIIGNIDWGDSANPLKEVLIKTWVNGFLQKTQSVVLDQNRFFTDLVLTQNSNRIQFEFPDIPIENSSRLMISLNCDNPQKSKRMRLLAVGVEMEDGKNKADPVDLERSALRALGQHVDQPGQDPARPPNVERIKSVVLTGSFNDAQFRAELNGVIVSMKRAAAQAKNVNNEVLMIYYRGMEFLDTDGNFQLRTTNERLNINGRELSRFLRSAEGAHLVCLDVQRDPQQLPTKIAGNWPNQDPYLGLFRVVWLDKKPVPDDARLAWAMQQAANGASPRTEVSLRDLNSRVQTILDQQVRKYPAKLDKQHNVPGILGDLVVIEN